MRINTALPCRWVQRDSSKVMLAIENCETLEAQCGSIATGKNVAVGGADVDVSTDPVKGQVVHDAI